MKLEKKHTKHYYIGLQRVSSALGTTYQLGLFPLMANNFFSNPSVMEDFRDVANAKVHTATDALSATYSAMNQSVALPNPAVEGGVDTLPFENNLYDAYFYHSDHLGSSNYISNNTGIVSQHTEYLPFGETFVDEHLNSHNTPFKFNAKEFDDETGNYYYGARYYNPKWNVWLSVDPLAEEYAEISPYIYVANNPIGNIDPDGRKIIGVTIKDAQTFKEDIHKVLADKKFEKVRALIVLKGSEFKSVDSKAINTALEGVSLSADEKAYIDLVTNTINSKEVHKIEYLSDAFTSTEGGTAFKDHMNKAQAGVGDAMAPGGKLSSSLIETMAGGGLNVPTKDGSHSFISSSLKGNERAVTSAHELFGHGIPSARSFGPKANNANAIKTDNLVRRLLNMPERDGSDHGGFKEGHITEPKKLPITQ
jgi:RHS repeat-associated protein